MIKRIELTNFMSHSHTVIEPADGLTVLVGPNNCGKSALVAALQIVAHNANSTYVMRHNEKACEIHVETSDGHSVKWSRTKSGSPKYEIDDEVFDRLKSKTPPQLDKILRLPKVKGDQDEFDIHFGQQKDPVFLLNDSGKAAAQFFASSSDAYRLVQMQDRHKKKVRSAKQDLKRLKAESEELEQEIEILSAAKEIDKSLKATEAEYQKLLKLDKDREQLVNTIGSIAEYQLDSDFQSAIAASMSKLSAPPQLAPANELEQLIEQLDAVSHAVWKNERYSTALKDLAPTPVLEDEASLDDLITNLQSVQNSAQVHTQRAKPLGQVKPPPELLETSDVESLVSQWRIAIATSRHLSRQVKPLESVPEPPEVLETQPLQQAIESINQGQDLVGTLQKQVFEISEQLNRLAEEASAFIEENPQCPTCGATVDPERLLIEPMLHDGCSTSVRSEQGESHG